MRPCGTSCHSTPAINKCKRKCIDSSLKKKAIAQNDSAAAKTKAKAKEQKKRQKQKSKRNVKSKRAKETSKADPSQRPPKDGGVFPPQLLRVGDTGAQDDNFKYW
jgi:hypothetical protein